MKAFWDVLGIYVSEVNSVLYFNSYWVSSVASHESMRILCICFLIDPCLSLRKKGSPGGPHRIHCFAFCLFLSCFGGYVYGGESRKVATNCWCRQKKSIRRQAGSEVEEGSYRFLCLVLVSFSEVVSCWILFWAKQRRTLSHSEQKRLSVFMFFSLKLLSLHF